MRSCLLGTYSNCSYLKTHVHVLPLASVAWSSILPICSLWQILYAFAVFQNKRGIFLRLHTNNRWKRLACVCVWWGGGCKPKNPPWGGMAPQFLELHNSQIIGNNDLALHKIKTFLACHQRKFRLFFFGFTSLFQHIDLYKACTSKLKSYFLFQLGQPGQPQNSVGMLRIYATQNSLSNFNTNRIYLFNFVIFVVDNFNLAPRSSSTNKISHGPLACS